MKKIIALISLGIAVILVASCTHDGLKGENYNKAKFSVSFSVNGLNTENKTRATIPVAEGEETVHKLHLFFFHADPNREGTLAAVITLDEDDDELEMSKKIPIIDDDLNGADAYNVIAIANIDDNRYISGSVSDWKANWGGSNERQFSEEVVASISFSRSGIQSDWIPMSGSATKEAGNGNIDITLTRVVARLDLINSANGYNLESVSVWNAYYTSSLTGDGVMDYSKVLGSRTQKFYDAHDATGNNATGQLYVFENKVIAPENGDRYTTCLIIGLLKNGETKESYYRINVHPNGSAQNLKRNNAYSITVNGVNGEGYPTEQDAYAGTTSELIYTINYWDLDDNGLIVSDMYSIMALPTKTVRIGQDGTTNSYTITTFSTLANPNPLTIKSQIYQPSDGSITATLSGNTLNITASDLAPGEADRSGIITLTYADLEASINVLQSSSVDKYLMITLDEDFSNLLPATAKSTSENIYVNASGPWTATLYDNDNTFSLKGEALTKEFKSSVENTNRFRVTTWTANNTTEQRKGFVLVSLDDDPLNYVSVVPMSQRIPSAVMINPGIDRITFNGSQRVTYPSNGKATITVTSATDHLKTPVFSSGGNNHFEIDHDIVDGVSQTGEVTIKTKANNNSGDSYTTTLILEDYANGRVELTITQNSLVLTVDPINLTTVTEKGGETEYVTVSTGDASSTYTPTIVTAANGSLFNHHAYIELDNGTIIREGETVSGISVDRKFRVVFPKIYYPNRERDITATVNVSIDMSSLSQPITAKQERLTSNGVYIWSTLPGNYCALGNTYLQAYTNYLNSYRSTISPGKTDVKNNSNSLSNVADYTYIHITNNYLNDNSSAIQTFINNVDGVTYFASDYNGVAAVNAINNGPMGQIGYTFANTSSTSTSSSVTVNTGASGRRIYQIMVDKALKPITQSIPGFYKDATSTCATTIPSTGTALLRDSNQRGILVIDPAHGFVYCGEGQVFWDSARIPAGSVKEQFMRNFVDYVCRSAMYGSHFNDMLVDYSVSDPNAVAAPWDPVWGTNAWPNRE